VRAVWVPAETLASSCACADQAAVAEMTPVVPLIVRLTMSPDHSPTRNETSKSSLLPAARFGLVTVTAARAPSRTVTVDSAPLIPAASDDGSVALK